MLDHVDDRCRRRGPAHARGHGGRSCDARRRTATTYVATELANCPRDRIATGRSSTRTGGGTFERFYDRGIDPAGTARQIMAMVASGDRTAALGGVTAPTLVIHGDVDTLVPLDGGEATARAIPGAELLVIPDMGHEIPPARPARRWSPPSSPTPAGRRMGPATGATGSAPVSGPLEGIRVVELAGIGPGSLHLHAPGRRRGRRPARRPGHGEPAGAGDGAALGPAQPEPAIGGRQPRSTPRGCVSSSTSSPQADGLVEGWRPGVAERLGIGPEQCLERNPRLVYGRMTGWGQDGPLASAAGHDINYIALAGALWPIGRVGERPVPPLNLVGDFGGGGMLLAFGMCAAMLEAQRSGRGQVVDAAMVDGAASLMTMTFAFRQLGLWTEGRGVNVLDTGAPFYEVYDTADGKWFAVGAIEPQFYAELLEVLGLDAEELPAQNDREQWPAMKERFAAIFRTRTRDEWAEAFAGTDACGAPVLSPWEAHTAPPQRAPRDLRRGRGRGAARPRAALQPDARPPCTSPRRSPGPTPRRPCRSWGIDDEPDRGPAPQRRRRLSGSADRRDRSQRFTTGQVTVRVMPSMSWMWLTTMRPRSSTDAAWVRTITS